MQPTAEELLPAADVMLDHAALARVDVSWLALGAAAVAVVAILVLRRFSRPEDRGHGRISVVLLVSSIVLRLLAWLLVDGGYPDIGGILRFASATALTAGMAGAVGLVLFDVLLTRIRVSVPTILRSLLVIVGFVVAMFALMRLRGADLVSLVTTSAVLTAVIGLALQEPIGNMFAGLSVQLDRTLRPGDWIVTGDREGRIQRVSFRSTSLLTREGNLVYLPNRMLVQSHVVNFTRPAPHSRATVEVGFHYRHAPSDIRVALLEAASSAPGVLAEPPPEVVIAGFDANAVHYHVYVWYRDFARLPQITGEVRTRIWYAAQRAKLEIPFPIRTVIMRTEADEMSRTAAEREDELASLRAIRLLAVLDEEDLSHLAAHLDRHHYVRGETIIRQGEPGDSLYLITEGEVSVWLAAEGQSAQLATLHAGDFVGEASLLTGDPRSATCIAESEVTCQVLTHDVLEGLLARKPALAARLSEVLAERQLSLSSEREELSAEAKRARLEAAGSALLARVKRFFKLD